MQDTTSPSTGTETPLFLWIEHAQGPDPESIKRFGTAEEREQFTVESIFGCKLEDLDTDDAEEAKRYLATLNKDGLLAFEGDPSLEWLDVHIKRSTSL